MFQEFAKMKAAGFTGFKTVSELWNNHSIIPNEAGIYLVLNPDCSKKDFLTKGVGGYFKDKDPNINQAELERNWIKDCHVLYIGKAGGANSSATLRKRVKQYLDFGKGKPVGHYGGRLIWQLKHHPELIFAWKVTKDGDPRSEEKHLIQEFTNYYGKLPFANLSN